MRNILKTGRWKLALIVIFATAVAGMKAEVIESSETGFLSRNEAVINAAPLEVYGALIDRIAGWWDPAHTFSGDSQNLSIEPKPGGCFCERLPDNGGVRHLTVVFLSPGKEVRLTGALGPLQQSGLAGSMTWKLSAEGGTTKVELSYSVGGYHRGGLRGLASPVDSVLRGQLLRLKSYIETGRP
jgi:hypothetical protein